MRLKQEQSDKLINRYLPKDVDFKWRKDGKLRPAWADEEDGIRTLLSPYPNTAMRALTFLHECAHFANLHWQSTIPDHEMEYEAERLAMEWWTNEEYEVPKQYLRSAKAYVRKCIISDRKKKIPIKQHIVDWSLPR